MDHDVEYEDNAVSMETFCYTDNENGTDAILFVIDYSVGYVQVILTTKNSSGENVGFTSYRQFISQEELALN